MRSTTLSAALTRRQRLDFVIFTPLHLVYAHFNAAVRPNNIHTYILRIENGSGSRLRRNTVAQAHSPNIVPVLLQGTIELSDYATALTDTASYLPSAIIIILPNLVIQFIVIAKSNTSHYY